MTGPLDWIGWRPKGRRSPAEQTPSSVCVVDPGSTGIRVLAAEIADGRAAILGWEEIAGGGIETGLRSTVTQLDAAIRRAEDAAQRASDTWRVPDHLIVGLPTSQLRGWSWPIKQRRPRHREPVTERELSTLLARALRLSSNRQMVTGKQGWVLLDALLIHLSVDGLGVTDPVGFRGREIEARVFAALAESKTIRRWRQIAETLEFASLDLVAAPVALAGCLPEPDCILLNVGEATTGVIWCQSRHPLALRSLPVGGAALTSALLRQWGMTPEKAEALKVAYTDGQLSEHAAGQVREVMIPILQEWLDLAESGLDDMSVALELPVPHQVALMGGGSALPEMLEAVRVLTTSGRLAFDRPVQITELAPRSVPGVVNRTDSGQTAADVPLLALAAWAGRQGKPPGRPARILAELCQA